MSTSIERWPMQHTADERLSLMRDLETSLRTAHEAGNEAREHYTREAIIALNHGD